MNDYTVLVEAIDRLTEAVNNCSYSFATDFVSALLAMLGSVAAVLIIELIKEKYFNSAREFNRLKRKVNSTLSMYACYYTNQIDIAHSDEREIELYRSASKSVREMSVELKAFINDINSKKCCGVPVGDVCEAADLLMSLSNNFFTPYGCPEKIDITENDEIRKDIKNLLRIDHKQKKQL